MVKIITLRGRLREPQPPAWMTEAMLRDPNCPICRRPFAEHSLEDINACIARHDEDVKG